MISRSTLTGRPFNYSGSLATGLTIIFPSSKYPMRIAAETIDIIRREITKRSPVRMGASRSEPLVADSVGETLKLKYNANPQAMSYVLPLLVAEKFCTVSDHKPFVIRRVRKTKRGTNGAL